MNNHNLVIYEFNELYKILVEIKKDNYKQNKEEEKENSYGSNIQKM